MEVCPGCGTCTTKARTAPGRTGWLIILVGLHPYYACPCFCTQGILWLMTGEHLAGGFLVAEGPGSGHSISLYPSGCFSHPGFLPHFLPSSFLLLASKDGVDLSQQHLNKCLIKYLGIVHYLIKSTHIIWTVIIGSIYTKSSTMLVTTFFLCKFSKLMFNFPKFMWPVDWNLWFKQNSTLQTDDYLRGWWY